MRTFRRLKIAVSVPGRFHAFGLAQGLVQIGHDVTLFTNYPRAIVQRFGFPARMTRPFVAHGFASKALSRLKLDTPLRVEKPLHILFGRWAAREMAKEEWDITYSFSGTAEEWLFRPRPPQTMRLVVRGSSHIRVQARLLAEEQQRTGAIQEKPSHWRIEREEREYERADGIVVLSKFAYETFLQQGFPRSRLWLISSGTDATRFSASPIAVAERCRRIRSGEPLRVLNVGTFSYRKGIWDLSAIVRSLDPARFRFRFVGDVASEAARMATWVHDRIEFVPRVAQDQLVGHYEWADVFVFPSIEEGSAGVCGQAAAEGLLMLASINSGASDLLSSGRIGWALPIRDPTAFIERLRWCDTHRLEVSDMIETAFHEFRPRGWSDVASDLTQLYTERRGSPHQVA
jgi:glycosyltransferase involved in cell wall biosynthesis